MMESSAVHSPALRWIVLDPVGWAAVSLRSRWTVRVHDEVLVVDFVLSSSSTSQPMIVVQVDLVRVAVVVVERPEVDMSKLLVVAHMSAVLVLQFFGWLVG